jgi:oxygen-independent coproporphyrinogen-3 oxidase
LSWIDRNQRGAREQGNGMTDAELVARYDGLAHWDGRRVAVSEKGRPFVRSVAAPFDAYLVQDTDKPRHARAVQRQGRGETA